ncbi:Dihydroorotate dehydrogenase (quinone), mitochondrial [Bachmanniomyces sp. S44760]|nr:Dihydroorotate dehydrogenase (quinone), mitochondrial [Bachmanniomyces sp. S44760]
MWTSGRQAFRPIAGKFYRSILLDSRAQHQSCQSSSTRIRPRSLHRIPTHSVRLASTSREVATKSRSLVVRLKNVFLGTAIGLSLIIGYFYITDTRAGIHQWLVVPSLRWLYDDAEDAHEAGTKALKGLYSLGLHPRERGNSDSLGDLKVEVFGHTLSNPIGTSAGIDKRAEIPSPLLALGPAVVELGGATPYPQDGNPKPRVFRLPSQRALINRYGLNSEGADDMAMRLRQRLREYTYSMGFGIDEEAEQRVLDGEAGVPSGSLVEGKLMAIQVAKNKLTPDSDIELVKKDYVYCVNALARYADIITVNVSSPNTPGLRGLQKVEPLTEILTSVVEAAKNTNRKTKPAVMVKVSPDEDSEEQVSGICDAVWRSGVDGVIVGNTTTRRPDPLPTGYALSSKEAAITLEQGGYSGPQLFDHTLKLVKQYRRLLDEGSLSIAPQTPNNSLRTSSKPSQAMPSPGSLPNRVSAAPVDDVSRHNVLEGLMEDGFERTDEDIASRIEDTVRRDMEHAKIPTPEIENEFSDQTQIRIPARSNPLSLDTGKSDDSGALSISHHIDQLPSSSTRDQPTDGILETAKADTGNISKDVADRIEASVQRDVKHLKLPSARAERESKDQPLIRLPARNDPFSSDAGKSDDSSSLAFSSHVDQLPSAKTPASSPSSGRLSVANKSSAATPETRGSPSSTLPIRRSDPNSQGPLALADQLSNAASSEAPQTGAASEKAPSSRKVIFATGGINNGQQALEVLNAGASVAMVYTALVYGGVGTISRLKAQLRDEKEKPTK